MLLLAAGLMFTGALSLVACEQEEGERCERDQDCATDLMCKVTPNGDKACRPSGYTDPVPPASLPDASAAETGIDGSLPDVPAADLAPEASAEVVPDAGVDSSAPATDVRLDVASDATGG